MLTKSLIISIFRYGAPLLINSNKIHINRLQTLLMKCARPLLGFKSFRMSTLQIMKKLNWLTIHQLIMAESIKIIHKITYENLPPAITKYITFPMSRENSQRVCRKPRMKVQPASAKSAQSLLYRVIFLFNQLPHEARSLNTKKFSKELNNNMRYIFPLKDIPKTDYG